jgi:type IV pilus assembly protein PilW
VELLVAMAIGAVVSLAAISMLVVSRGGFVAVDAASQLRDSARFAGDLLQRIGVQAGYKDITYAATTRPSNVIGVATDPAPGVSGFNNALASVTDPENLSTPRVAGSEGNGSDVLILRFQSSETFPGSGVSDRSMIDCLGQPATAVATGRDSALVSILHVGTSQGEPALMCTTVSASGTVNPAQPIVQGVENFQVLYGADAVIGHTVPVPGTTDSVADTYLRADEMVVAGDALATRANWRRVRSLRIGMVLRGPARAGPDTAGQAFHPLGSAPGADGGEPGGAMSSPSDPGSDFAVPADGRFRQVSTFTVHLRNSQGL